MCYVCVHINTDNLLFTVLDIVYIVGMPLGIHTSFKYINIYIVNVFTILITQFLALCITPRKCKNYVFLMILHTMYN